MSGSSTIDKDLFSTHDRFCYLHVAIEYNDFRLCDNLRCVYIGPVENMEKITSMPLMLVILGLFITSSQAITCYHCSTADGSSGCGDPFDTSETCGGAICAKIKYEAGGQITRYFLFDKHVYFLLYYITTFIL